MSIECPRTATAEAVASGTERILVIDDEAPIRSTLEEFLELSGFEVRTAANGEEGLDLLGREDYDLVLSDLKMPGVDGIAVIEWMKETRPETPVVVMSGHATVDSALRALRLGAYDYLLKPFTLDEIHRTIGNCLEKRRLRRKNVELEASNVRLREIERMKDDLLATVSHEFRTPLTAIRGFLDLLDTGHGNDLRSDQSQAFEAIRSSVDRLDMMIGNLLTLTECQDGGYQPILQPVPVGEFLRECVPTQGAASPHGEPELDIEEAAEAYVLLDTARFPLVLRNLLDNAFKFRREERPARVILRARREDSQVVLEVHDDGIGVTDALGDHLFERFTQADMTSTRRHAGVGLGLAVVREIVRAHGGTVRLVSPVLGGTSVRIALPALPGTDGR